MYFVIDGLRGALDDGLIGGLELKRDRWGLLVFPLRWIWLEALPVLLHVNIASAFTLRNGYWSSLGCFKMNYYNVMDKKKMLLLTLL